MTDYLSYLFLVRFFPLSPLIMSSLTLQLCTTKVATRLVIWVLAGSFGEPKEIVFQIWRAQREKEYYRKIK